MKCIVLGCSNPSVSRLGFCRSHAASPPCSHESGCRRPAYAKDGEPPLCAEHGGELPPPDSGLDSTGRWIKIGDKVRFRGRIYTVAAFHPGEGRQGTRGITFEEPVHVQESADELGVDLVPPRPPRARERVVTLFYVLPGTPEAILHRLAAQHLGVDPGDPTIRVYRAEEEDLIVKAPLPQKGERRLAYRASAGGSLDLGAWPEEGR